MSMFARDALVVLHHACQKRKRRKADHEVGDQISNNS